jgi:hypothetical protein
MEFGESHNEKVWAKKMAKIYSSRRLKNKMIRRMEGNLANIVTEFYGNTNHAQKNRQQIESALEWFMTWRIKLSAYKEPMWCDGIQNLDITSSGRGVFHIKGQVIIGPESNVRHLYKCPLSGTLSLSRNFKTINKYRIELVDNGEKYLFTKT